MHLMNFDSLITHRKLKDVQCAFYRLFTKYYICFILHYFHILVYKKKITYAHILNFHTSCTKHNIIVNIYKANGFVTSIVISEDFPYTIASFATGIRAHSTRNRRSQEDCWFCWRDNRPYSKMG